MGQKTKKKVFYVITKSVWAGASKYVYELATALPKDKFEVFVAAGGEGELAKRLQQANIPYFEIKHFQRDISFLKEFFAYFELFWLFLKIKPDIIHTNSSKAAGIAGTAALDYKFLTLNFKVRTIFTAHGWAFHEDRPKWQIYLIKLFSQVTCLYYKKIICVSEFDRRSALKNKIAPARKLITIHNGIKTDEYEFLSKEKARQQLGSLASKLGPNDIWIGTIGEFTKNKGQEYLIEAIKKLQDTRSKMQTIIIGFGEDKEKLQAKIKKLKLQNSVFLLDNLPQAARYLKAFDVFVLPSLKEGLPYTLLEAGLARLPVIASDVGGIPEIIKDQETGLLVKPASNKKIKESLEKIINDVELKSVLAFALWGKVHQEFRFGKMLERTLATYEKKPKTGKSR